jgi:glycosyltransferase involved in cell wall biosynthesis
MRILVLPRDDQNPYQRLLYEEMRPLGVQVSYLGELTPSHTLNLALLPAELVAWRARGVRLIHVHWVYRFGLPLTSRFPVLRRFGQWWFLVWLWTARVLGMRLVWTVHNVLPHSQVFADDVAARRSLVAVSDLVIAHSRAALGELAALGAVPIRSAVIPHGPLVPTGPAAALRIPGSGDGPRQFLFFGQVHEYKGVEDLLAAFAALPADVAARLVVAGQCADPGLRSRLTALAHDCGGRVELRLDRVPDERVSPLLASADVIVLPYRRITTSGSAMLALAHGRPLIVPDVPALAGLCRPAVVRYDQTQLGLCAALTTMALAEGRDLATMSAAAQACADTVTWRDIAVQTMTEMGIPPGEGAVRPAPGPGISGRRG